MSTIDPASIQLCEAKVYSTEDMAVYEAEAWFENLPDDERVRTSCEELLSIGQAEAEAVEILIRAGYHDPDITVLLTIHPDEGRSGSYDSAANVIHGEVAGITRFVLLHELAHWVRPHVGHGPQFRAAHLQMVDIAFGANTADVLAFEYEQAGLWADPNWYHRSTAWAEDLMFGEVA